MVHPQIFNGWANEKSTVETSVSVWPSNIFGVSLCVQFQFSLKTNSEQNGMLQDPFKWVPNIELESFWWLSIQIIQSIQLISMGTCQRKQSGDAAPSNELPRVRVGRMVLRCLYDGHVIRVFTRARGMAWWKWIPVSSMLSNQRKSAVSQVRSKQMFRNEGWQKDIWRDASSFSFKRSGTEG